MLTRSKRKHSLGKKPLKKRRSVKQYSKNIKGGNLYEIDAEGYYVLNDNKGTPYRVCKEVSEETLYLMYNGGMYSRSVELKDGSIFRRTAPKDLRTLGYSSGLSFIEPKTYINHNGDEFFANGYNAEHINNFKKERAKIIKDSLIEFKRDLVKFVRINQKLPYNELTKIYNDKMKEYNEKKFSIQVEIGLVNKEIEQIDTQIKQIDKQIEQIDTQIKTQKDSIDNIDNRPLEKYSKHYSKKNNKNLSRNNAKAQELKLQQEKQHEENARKFEEKQKEDIKERYSLKIVELETRRVELEKSRVELENRRVERIPEIQVRIQELEQELHDSVEIPIIALTEEYNRELNKLDANQLNAIPENIESPQTFIPDRPIETIIP